MKFEEQKIIVRLGEGDEQAIVTFIEPLENERLQIVELGKENIRKALQFVYKNCVKVENLFYENSAVTVDDIRSGNVRGTIADAIVIGYFAAITTSPDSAEKKD